jgi:hypothetical protein
VVRDVARGRRALGAEGHPRAHQGRGRPLGPGQGAPGLAAARGPRAPARRTGHLRRADGLVVGAVRLRPPRVLERAVPGLPREPPGRAPCGGGAPGDGGRVRGPPRQAADRARGSALAAEPQPPSRLGLRHVRARPGPEAPDVDDREPGPVGQAAKGSQAQQVDAKGAESQRGSASPGGLPRAYGRGTLALDRGHLHLRRAPPWRGDRAAQGGPRYALLDARRAPLLERAASQGWRGARCPGGHRAPPAPHGRHCGGPRGPRLPQAGRFASRPADPLAPGRPPPPRAQGRRRGRWVPLHLPAEGLRLRGDAGGRGRGPLPPLQHAALGVAGAAQGPLLRPAPHARDAAPPGGGGPRLRAARARALVPGDHRGDLRPQRHRGLPRSGRAGALVRSRSG